MAMGFARDCAGIGTYPLTPLLASLVVGYACACEEGGMAIDFARDLRERFWVSMARSIRAKPSE